MNIIYVLLFMLFAHIVDDFYLQGILAKLKQKTFWGNDEIGKKPKYKYDYIVALIIHAFSWAFMIMLPIMVFKGFNEGILTSLMIGVTILSNTTMHAVIDHLKANKLKINLVVDQSLHLVQIVITWVLWVLWVIV